jgi:hypothetical protein
MSISGLGQSVLTSISRTFKGTAPAVRGLSSQSTLEFGEKTVKSSGVLRRLLPWVLGGGLAIFLWRLIAKHRASPTDTKEPVRRIGFFGRLWAGMSLFSALLRIVQDLDKWYEARFAKGSAKLSMPETASSNLIQCWVNEKYASWSLPERAELIVWIENKQLSLKENPQQKLIKWRITLGENFRHSLKCQEANCSITSPGEQKIVDGLRIYFEEHYPDKFLVHNKSDINTWLAQKGSHLTEAKKDIARQRILQREQAANFSSNPKEWLARARTDYIRAMNGTSPDKEIETAIKNFFADASKAPGAEA